MEDTIKLLVIVSDHARHMMTTPNLPTGQSPGLPRWYPEESRRGQPARMDADRIEGRLRGNSTQGGDQEGGEFGAKSFNSMFHY